MGNTGKGTFLANGQGDEEVYVFVEVKDAAGNVKIAAGSTISDFNTSGTPEKGNIYFISWDAANSCGTVDASSGALAKAVGTCNNAGGKSTMVGITTKGSTPYRVTSPVTPITIQTGAYDGPNNTGFAGKQVYCVPVNTSGCGWLVEK